MEIASLCSLFLIPHLALGQPPRPPDADFVSLAGLKEKYGFPELVDTGTAARLRSDYTTLTFMRNSRQVYFNSVLIWMNAGLSPTPRGPALTSADATRVIGPLLAPAKALERLQSRSVVLDPGHGGGDGGAQAPSLLEKKATLAIAQHVRAALEQQGIEVFMTRETDRAISLRERARLAARKKAGLFISIHLNSAGNTNAKGIETYVLPAPTFPSTSGEKVGPTTVRGNDWDGASQVLAYRVQRSLLARTGCEDRGIKRARFEVLTRASCPAILVECGFLSNTSEAPRLRSRGHQEAIARGIASGIIDTLALRAKP